MIRLVWRLALLAALAALFAWLADRPGTVTIQWLGREIETPLLAAAAALLIVIGVTWMAWSLLRRLLRSPAALGDYLRYRRSRRGYESLSRGIIAAGAGDAAAAARHAKTAARGLDDEPLLKLLQAQAAQLKGDRAAVKAAFEAMLASPDTEALGRRGLFAEARQAGDMVKAQQMAERALKLNPALAWASSALLAIHTAAKDWSAAAIALEAQRRTGQIDAASANRKRAALLAAQALAVEDQNRAQAQEFALAAHRLDPALVPAAAVAARGYIEKRSPRKAARIIRKCWALSPHPDLAELQAHAVPGAMALERLERVRDLVAELEGGDEGKVALGRAAVAARDWTMARRALLELIDGGQPQARVCALMADIEEGETGDKGRAREWLARAMRAPRDPMWVAGGVAVPAWTPVSPLTGELVDCEWKVPYDVLEAGTPAASAADPVPPASSESVKPSLPPPAARPKPIEPIRAPDDPGPAGDPDDADPQTQRRLAAGG